MPKKQPQDVEIDQAKIPSRRNILVAAISGLVALISVIWGLNLLRNIIKEPSPTAEPTSTAYDWYVIFELKFPVNYWAEGVHSFLFNADCPPGIHATSENGPTNPFSVDRTAETLTSTVFIRRRGLYLTEIEGDAFGHLIHPSQETAAVYSLLTVSFEDAKRLKDKCKVLMKIDNASFVNLTAIKIRKTQ